MKICLLCYRGNKYCGGQGIYLYYLARELVRQGHEVDVMVGPPYADVPGGAREFRLESLNLYDRRHDGRSPLHGRKSFDLLSPFNLFEFGGNKLGMFPEMLTFSLRAYRQIKSMLPTHRYDVIHDNQCLAYGLLLMRSLGIPVVATIHHPLPIDTRADLAQESNPWKRFRQLLLYPPLMQGIVARRLDAVITDSDSSIHEIEATFRVPRERMRRVYLGIDTDIFHNVDGHHTATDGNGSRQWQLIMVGRTSDRKKGVLYLLRALRLLKNDRVPVKLSIVDEIEKNDTYAADLVSEYGIGDMVEFTGRLLPDELVQRYSRSDIAVTASVYEGFGLPAAEAMACGIPVVATDTGALPEVVGRDGCCLLVPPKDPQALADAIKRLVGDAELRRRLAVAGRQRIETLFSWENAVRQIVDVYKEVASY